MSSRLNAIARRRLANQHLVSPTLSEAAQVVRALGAVQSQDFGGAKWAIAQRTKGLTDSHIDDAFAKGAILRTHVLRPTWHFVLPEDARWMLALTAPRVMSAMAYHARSLELDAKVFRKSHAVIERALRDGKHLTRSELSAILGRAGVDVSSGQRVGHVLMQAEVDRVIISGARRGKHITYALFDERVPAAPPRDRDEALHDLTRRYFATRGPATVHDFAWWSGLAVRDAQRGVEAAGPFLVRETHDGRTYWSAPGERAAPRSRRVAHLLPTFDEYVVGFKDRSAFAERLRGVRQTARLDSLIGHGLFLNGQFVGGWRRTLGTTLDLELRLRVRLTLPEREHVERAARRFGDFLGLPVRVRR